MILYHSICNHSFINKLIMYTTNNAFDLYEEQFSQPERNLPNEGDEPKKRPEIEPEITRRKSWHSA